MKKPRPYRIGDIVRVLRPKWIKRVGYPLHYTDLLEEVEKDPRSWQALAILEGREFTLFDGLSKGAKLPHEFAKCVARMRVQERGFGGRERAIIYEPEVPPEPGSIYLGPCFDLAYLQHCYVRSKRVVYTGTYSPGGYYESYDGREDYYPELCDRKAHVLLMLDSGYEIEACNVELVKEASDNA